MLMPNKFVCTARPSKPSKPINLIECGGINELEIKCHVVNQPKVPTNQLTSSSSLNCLASELRTKCFPKCYKMSQICCVIDFCVDELMTDFP